MLVPMENIGSVGIITDVPPQQLPLNTWSGGNNVRMLDGYVNKCAGFEEVLATCPVTPYYITPLEAGGNYFWIACGLAKVYVHNGSAWSNITRQTGTTLDGAVGSGVGTITLTDGSDFPAGGGSVCVGAATTYEELTYTSRTGNVLTLSGTTTVAHLDNEIVNPLRDTLTTDNDYTATATGIVEENWSSSVIGGILILNNFVDVPQEWSLSKGDGQPQSTYRLRDLANWTTTDRAKTVKSFKSFLIAMNTKEGSLEKNRVVRWSTEAQVQDTPISWDVNDDTVDAGEYELAATKGSILDGMAMRDSFQIYKENSIYSATYVGTPFIFQFKILSPTVGLLAKNCVAEFEGGHFVFGTNNLYVNDGQRLLPLLNKRLQNLLLTSIDGDNFSASFVVADYNRNEMLACFPETGQTTCTAAIIWNWKDNTISKRSLSNLSHASYGVADVSGGTSWDIETTLDGTITASVPATGAALSVNTDPTTTFPSTGTLLIGTEEITYTGMTASSFTGITRGANGTTAAGHTSGATVARFASWDDTTSAWGTRTYSNKEKVLLFCSPTDTKIYRDNIGNKEGTSLMTSYIERTGISAGEKGERDYSAIKTVTSVYPLMEVFGSSNTVDVYVGSQMDMEGGVSWSDAYAFNPDTMSRVPCRKTGRYYGVKFESKTDVEWKLHGLQFEVTEVGARGGRSY